MKLTKEQIEKIKELRKNGKKIVEIARFFNVTSNTIIYHLDDSFKEKLREAKREWYRKLSRTEKKAYFENKREYQNKYHKERYANDPDFRAKQLERVKTNSKKRTKSREVK